MDLSRGTSRPPVFDRPVRLTLALGLCGAALLAAAASAQPSPSLFLWLSSRPPAAAPESPVLAPGPETRAIPPGSVIGEVRVVARGHLRSRRIPARATELFRLANRLHRTTRPGVIQSQLLFQPGDVFSPELVEESARLLRSNDYLYDVAIRPVLRGDGKVDVEVKTRDVWTLQGGASFGRAGGRNSTSFSLDDSNFLGTGKEVSLARIGTVDRTSNLVRFTDPNLVGSRVRLLLSYADNSDGGRQRLEVERPFYSLDTRWAAGLRSFHDDRLESLYSLGKVETAFRHQTDFVEVYGGLSSGLVGGATHRWEAGFTYSRDDFERSSRPFPFFAGKELIDRIPLPPDRTLAYPWLRFQSIQNRFVVEKDLDRIQRSEDLNLGRQFSAARRPLLPHLRRRRPALGGADRGLGRLASRPRARSCSPSSAARPAGRRGTPRTWSPAGASAGMSATSASTSSTPRSAPTSRTGWTARTSSCSAATAACAATPSATRPATAASC